MVARGEVPHGVDHCTQRTRDGSGQHHAERDDPEGERDQKRESDGERPAQQRTGRRGLGDDQHLHLRRRRVRVEPDDDEGREYHPEAADDAPREGAAPDPRCRDHDERGAQGERRDSPVHAHRERPVRLEQERLVDDVCDEIHDRRGGDRGPCECEGLHGTRGAARERPIDRGRGQADREDAARQRRGDDVPAAADELERGGSLGAEGGAETVRDTKDAHGDQEHSAELRSPCPGRSDLVDEDGSEREQREREVGTRIMSAPIVP